MVIRKSYELRTKRLKDGFRRLKKATKANSTMPLLVYFKPFLSLFKPDIFEGVECWN